MQTLPHARGRNKIGMFHRNVLALLSHVQIGRLSDQDRADLAARLRTDSPSALDRTVFEILRSRLENEIAA